MRTTWRRLGGEASDATVEDVIARYNEPARRYHTVDHVAVVLHRIEDLLAGGNGGIAAPVDADVVRAGGLFHDVVYDPRSATNEADSATLAVEAMQGLGWGAARAGLLRDVIVATATHSADSPESAVLLDADLAILGSPPQDYRRYVEAVRAEYSFVDDAGWVTGRSAVLQSLLVRPHIFATPAMRTTHEAQARCNLADESALLRTGVHQGDDLRE